MIFRILWFSFSCHVLSDDIVYIVMSIIDQQSLLWNNSAGITQNATIHDIVFIKYVRLNVSFHFARFSWLRENHCDVNKLAGRWLDVLCVVVVFQSKKGFFYIYYTFITFQSWIRIMLFYCSLCFEINFL